MSVYCNGEEIENNMGFPVARDMARLLSLSDDCEYQIVGSDGEVAMTYKNGEII